MNIINIKYAKIYLNYYHELLISATILVSFTQLYIISLTSTDTVWMTDWVTVTSLRHGHASDQLTMCSGRMTMQCSVQTNLQLNRLFFVYSMRRKLKAPKFTKYCKIWSFLSQNCQNLLNNPEINCLWWFFFWINWGR